MTNRLIIYDNFTDNSIDPSKWDVYGPVEETTGKLRFPANETDPLSATTIDTFDLTTGDILTTMVTKTGTGNRSIEVAFQVQDILYNYVTFWFTTVTPNDTRVGYDGITFTSETLYDTAVNMGPGWTSFDYIGIQYTGSSIKLMKSTDGQTWSDIWVGVIDTNSVDLTELYFATEVHNTYQVTSNYRLSIDDVGLWTPYPRAKVRVGGSTVLAEPKVRVGSSWVNCFPKARSSGTWVGL